LRTWQAALVALVAWAFLRGIATDPVLDASEADALAAGVDLATALTAEEGSVKERLALGFATHADNAKVALLPQDQRWRHAVVEAPTPRWTVAIGVMLAPASGSATNLERAASGAAAWVALAIALLVATLWRRDRIVALAAPLLLLVLPGVLDASRAAGAAASAVFVSVLLVTGVERWSRPGAPVGASPRTTGGALVVALAWGLALGLHPGAVFLLVPIFVAFALATMDRAAEPGPPGELRLPWAPLTLFMVPVLGLVALVILWPALWQETGKRLGAWLMDTWWLFNPSHDVGGVVFDQAHDRAAMGWTGFAAWVAWTPVPVLVAWGAGVVSLARKGRAARWFPLLAWVTLMLVGAADGGLWGGRLALLPLLWVPTAMVAAEGVGALGALLARRLRIRVGVARLSVTVGVVALTLAAAGVGWPPAPLSGVGAELARPVPTSWLRAASEAGGGVIAVAPDAGQWESGVEAASDALELDLRRGPVADARWLLVVGAGPGEVEARVAGLEPWRAGAVGGVTMRLYDLAKSGAGARASTAVTRPGPG